MNPALDYALDGVTPRRVLQPHDRRGLAHELGLARARGAAVLPRGCGTRLTFGAPPRALDLVLLTGGLDRVVAYEPGDLTITVEAGITLAELTTRLAEHGQWLPARGAHPARPGPGSLGGLLATAPAGLCDLDQGRVRERVLGSVAALPDGTLVKGRGRVVKNVAGFDVPRLLTGSFGTLGVLVECTLKLQPLPAARVTLSTDAADDDAAGRLERALRDGPDEPAFVVWRGGDHAPARLHVGFDGGQARVAGALSRTRALIEAHGGTAPRVLHDDHGEILRAELDDPVRSLIDDDTDRRTAAILRISATPSTLGPALQAARDAARHAGGTSRFDLRPGNGLAWLALQVTDAERLAPACTAALSAARAHTATVLRRAPLALRRDLDVWGPPPADLFLMQRIKQSCDPTGALVAGRFVGGL